MRVRIPNDDRPKLALISNAEDVHLEGNSFCQLRDIFAIDRTIARKFGECQVMGVEGEEFQALKATREQLDQALCVRFGQARDSDMLEMNTMLEPAPAISSSVIVAS